MQQYQIKVLGNLIIYLLHLQLSLCEDDSDASGMPKIINGNDTSIRYAPFMVNLRYYGSFTCGGALITPKCVLTAAHCVYGKLPSDFTVHAGASRLSEQGKWSRVKLGFISSAFSPQTLDMDVAVLHLEKKLNTHNITTIAVSDSSPSSSQYVRLFGWGRTQEVATSVPDKLQTAKVKVMSREVCRKAYEGRMEITDTMFCASGPGERDSCSGDSGGPVIYRREVCGIVSWGIGCGREQFPGVYTNVTSQRVSNFVKHVTNNYCN